MGAPTSEIGYTTATTRRGDHEVNIDRWLIGKKKKERTKKKRKKKKSQCETNATCFGCMQQSSGLLYITT
jgi:hypothetical protein